jgi:DnaK suppressor protein
MLPGTFRGRKSLFLLHQINGTARALLGCVPPRRDGEMETKRMKTQEIKKALLAKQKELHSRQISPEDIAIEKNAEVFDEIQRNADRTLALDSLTRNWKTASLVTEALQRIADGSYGVCEECDETINEKRIAALPWAKYCIHCQERADKSTVETQWTEAA